MARLIDADKVIKDLEAMSREFDAIAIDGMIKGLERAETVDAIPIDDAAEMLADLFGDECACDYNDIAEWLPLVCENAETCPDVIGKHGCWKQYIKAWREKRENNE